MADLKLGTQIGGNLVWHQGILDLNPVDDKLFFRQFDVITEIGGQTIKGGLSLQGDVDTTGRMFGKGSNGSWGSSSKGAFSQEIENDSSAHWLLTSNRKDGSGRAGIQVLTSNTGIMRMYTDNISKYVDIGGGQVSVQATMPSSVSHLTRKDYVDNEVKRSMDYTDSKDTATNATVAALETRVTTLDAQNVKITGNQTIAGVKTFSSHITVPAADPTAATQAAHKGYVDKLNSTSVKGVTATSPVVSTGGINPVISIAPATRASAGSMSSDDKIKLDDLPADALSRSGGTMKPNGFIKMDGVGGIQSITAGKEYSIFRDHNNGNVTVSAAGGDLYIGYKTDAQQYTTKDVLLYSPMKWSSTGRVLVDSDGFIPWASVKDRIGLEGKSKPLKGPINFDNLESTGDYNLYLAKATGSKNPPPFDYGTMSVVGSDKDGNTFVTQVATDQRTGISYTRTRNDGAMAWTSWIENANEFSDMGYSYHNKFEVGGDADTFYPVEINVRGASDGMGWKRYCFSRIYNEKAPDTWNNKTHKGGLTFAFEFTNDTGWGGNSHRCLVNEFGQSYTTVAGGMVYTTGSMIVWLRGGGASYWFHSNEGIKGGIVVHLDKYVASDKKEFLPRTKAEADQGLIDEVMPRFSIRNGEVYDRDRRVLVADGTIPMTGDLKIEKEKAALILKNAAGAPADKAENYGRIRFEHATGDQHVELMHSVHDDYRAGYGLRLLKPEDNKGASGAWLDVQGDTFAQNFIQTTAQSTNVASCTRKDYVDAIDAKNVAKTGDVMTGSLTFSNDSQLIWSRNSDFAKIGFKNDADSDTDAHMWFETGDNGNEYFKFRYRMSGSATAVDLLDIAKGKADFHVPIYADAVKNAMLVNGKGSISFQDGSNTRYHLWADGGAFRLSHGNDAQNPILNILSNGAVSSTGTFTATDFLQSTAQTNLPNASTRKDYVDTSITTLTNNVYAKAASDARYVLKAGDTMTGALINTAMITSNVSIGVDANTRKVAFEIGTDKIPYISVDYAYRALQFNDNKTVTATNGFEINGTNSNSNYFVNYTGFGGGWARGLTAVNSAGAVGAGIGFLGSGSTVTDVYLGVGTSPWGDGALSAIKINANTVNINKQTWFNGGAIQINSASNSVLEFHTPGKHARMIWMDGNNGDLNFSQSNGSFGEAKRLAKFDSVGNFLSYNRMYVPSYSMAWGTSGSIAALTDEVRVATGQWYPMLSSPNFIHNTQGYASRWSIGHFRSTDNRNGEFVINMTGDGYLRNNQRFHFNDIGGINNAGTHDGSWFALDGNGRLNGSVWGGSIDAWVNANFALKSTAVGDIGTYAFLGKFDRGGAVGPGTHVAGSSLFYTQAEGTSNGGSPAGTWVCMGYAKGEHDYGSWNCTLWRRVA